jgi:hypothetical protein
MAEDPNDQIFEPSQLEVGPHVGSNPAKKHENCQELRLLPVPYHLYKTQNQIQNQQTLYSTQITILLLTLIPVLPISLSPRPKPTSGCSVPIHPATPSSHFLLVPYKKRPVTEPEKGAPGILSDFEIPDTTINRAMIGHGAKKTKDKGPTE